MRVVANCFSTSHGFPQICADFCLNLDLLD